MELNQLLDALATREIEVAFDVGEHGTCDIKSNCPFAIRFREQLKELNLDYSALEREQATRIEVFRAANINPEFIMDFSGLSNLGLVEIPLFGQTVTIPLKDLIKETATPSLMREIRIITEERRYLSDLSRRLMTNYYRKMDTLTNTAILPQLSFPIKVLIETGALISTLTMHGINYYNIAFKALYSPEVVTSGQRMYGIENKYRAAMTRVVLFCFMITKVKEIKKCILLNFDGSKFSHYHGGNSDCWGDLDDKIYRVWDGSLDSLIKMATELMGVLKIINIDSILNNHPTGMPGLGVLLPNRMLMRENSNVGIEPLSKFFKTEDKTIIIPTNSITGWRVEGSVEPYHMEEEREEEREEV